MSKVKSVSKVWIAIPFIAAAAILLISHFYNKNEANKVEQTQICEEWKSKYSVITKISSKGFTLGRGSWVIEVDQSSWKKVVMTHHTWWVSSKPKTIRMKTPDKNIMSGASHTDYSNIYNSFQFKGKGCMLFTTNKELFEDWREKIK